jgi:heme exporter protein D
MLALGPHAGFIIAAYAVTAATIGGLAAWILFDRRAVRRRLKQLEAEGVRRRSEQGARR